MEIAAGEYGYEPFYSAACSRPARWTCSRPTPRAAAATPASSGRRARRRVEPCRSPPIRAPALHLPVCCAAPRLRHVEWFHDHVRIEHMLFDGAPEPENGVITARPRRAPATACTSSAPMPSASRSDGAEGVRHGRHGPERSARSRARAHRRPRGIPDRRTTSGPERPNPDRLHGDARRSTPRRLRDELAAAIEGEVRFDDGSRALYATDASNYRQVPIGVVIPKTNEDVMQTVAICRRHHAPILSRGGGTSLAGQCCNVAVVIDFSKYLNRVLEIDSGRRIARVEPGCILDDLRDEAAEARPDLRPRSRDPRPQHARRHDRQQLLRRARGHERQHRRQRPGARDADLRRRCA